MSDRTAPLSLWTIAQTFLNTLFALFGPPEAVAFQHTHTGAQRALMLPWLRAGEALMRRLLLIEASAYPRPNTRPLLARPRKRAKRIVGFDDDKPETWRVSFRCFTALNSSPASRSLRERANESWGGSGSRRSRETKGERKPQDYPASIGDMTFHQGPRFTAKPAKFYSAWPLAERYEAVSWRKLRKPIR